MKNKNIVYVEPADYFPKSIRKKCKLGEYAQPKNKEVNLAEKKTTAKE